VARRRFVISYELGYSFGIAPRETSPSLHPRVENGPAVPRGSGWTHVLPARSSHSTPASKVRGIIFSPQRTGSLTSAW